jgi:hypothetical protein
LPALSWVQTYNIQEEIEMNAKLLERLEEIEDEIDMDDIREKIKRVQHRMIVRKEEGNETKMRRESDIRNRPQRDEMCK